MAGVLRRRSWARILFGDQGHAETTAETYCHPLKGRPPLQQDLGHLGHEYQKRRDLLMGGGGLAQWLRPWRRKQRQERSHPPMAEDPEARGGDPEQTREIWHSMPLEIVVRKILSCCQVRGGSSGSSSPFDRRSLAGRV